jgi:hypothetical protein
MAAKAKPKQNSYSVIDIKMSGGMLLMPLRNPPNDQSWTMGEFFTQPPSEPLIAKIRDGYESAEPREFMSVPPLMSKKLYNVLKNAGVFNLQIFDVTIQSKDQSVKISDFFAYNLVGLIRSADMKKSKFSPSNSSRETDVWFDQLKIKDSLETDLLMFRMAEDTSTILVHESIRKAIEAAGFENVKFSEA